MPVGVHGVARVREWDAVAALEIEELEGTSLSEVAFKVVRDGTVLGDVGNVPEVVIERLAWLAREESGLPAEVRAVRTGVRDWSVAVRRARLELLELPDVDASEIALAIAPGGERTLLVDGEERDEDGDYAVAAIELEARGRARHRTFVARATRVAGGWELTIDPL
jgi:hypothetical protein